MSRRILAHRRRPAEGAALRFDQHHEILVPGGDRIGAEVGRAAVLQRHLRQVLEVRGIGERASALARDRIPAASAAPRRRPWARTRVFRAWRTSSSRGWRRWWRPRRLQRCDAGRRTDGRSRSVISLMSRAPWMRFSSPKRAIDPPIGCAFVSRCSQRGVRRPAVRRNGGIVGGAERRTEEIAREKAQVRQQRLVGGNVRVVHPGRGVERRERAAVALDLD